MHRVVAITRSTCGDRYDLEVATTHQDLGVARVTVVLGLGSTSMVAGWDQGAVHDPRPASIATRALGVKCREPRNHGGKDSMHCRLGDLKYGGELADRQVRAQRHAGDQHTVAKRARPWTATSSLDRQATQNDRKSTTSEGREHEHARDRHCQKRGVGSVYGVVWQADTGSEQADAVVA